MADNEEDKSYIISNSKCSCGNGDSENASKGYFANECPNCGNKGCLKIEYINNNVEATTEESQNTNNENQENSDSNANNDEKADITQTQADDKTSKIICTKCGSEYCGQDGYDLAGGNRARLTTVNPDEVEDAKNDVSTSEEDETTYMSGWEGLCDLLKPLDGQAMMVQRGDFVVIKKIEMPNTAKLWAYEGINIVDDSISITDYTPEIYNTFVVKWGESYENELEFTFKKHKQLFGERKKVVEAKKYAVVEEEGEEKTEEDDGPFWDIFGFFKNNQEKKESEKDTSKTTPTGTTNNNNTNPTDQTNTNTDGNTGNTDATTEGTGDPTAEEENQEPPSTEEVPITTREEAIQFGMTEIGKAKRDDGHKIELKVIGNSNWQMGEWCRVKIPSFDEDSYMFISKCSFESSADSEYITSLTLVDYPPSLGKPKKPTTDETDQATQEADSENTDENSTENGTDTGSTDGNTTGTDNNDNNNTTNN